MVHTVRNAYLSLHQDFTPTQSDKHSVIRQSTRTIYLVTSLCAMPTLTWRHTILKWWLP